MTKGKPDWKDYYTMGSFLLLLTAFGIHTFTKKEQNNLEQTTIKETTKDSIPQVNNYEFIYPVSPVWKDPISNVYSPLEKEQ